MIAAPEQRLDFFPAWHRRRGAEPRDCYACHRTSETCGRDQIGTFGERNGKAGVEGVSGAGGIDHGSRLDGRHMFA